MTSNKTIIKDSLSLQFNCIYGSFNLNSLILFDLEHEKVGSRKLCGALWI